MHRQAAAIGGLMVSSVDARIGPEEGSPEERFLRYIRTGDKAIIQPLIREYADRSFNQARRIIGRDDGAEDAVQEAYLLLINTAKRYDGSVPFAAWLGRLVSSSAIDLCRRWRKERNLSSMSDGGAAAMNNRVAKSDAGDPPAIDALRAALESLPDHYRNPLTLYYFSGLSQAETAKALGAPAGTIAGQLARGLESLREKLGRHGFALSSAGLTAMLASIPSYAASAEFKAALVASERLEAMSPGSQRLPYSGATLGIAAKTAILGVILACVALAVTLFTRHPHQSASVGTPVASVDSGLIAHWSFDDGKGLIAADETGALAGQLINGPKWCVGKITGALAFNGRDNYVNVQAGDELRAMTDQTTISAWVFKTAATDDYETIVQRRIGQKFDDCWALQYGDEIGQRYHFAVFTSQGEGRVAGPSSVDDGNAWTHLAGTYDGAMVRLYRNGVLAASQPWSGTITNEFTPVVIGASDNGTYGMSEFFDGVIDDVRLYDRALSAGEIAALAAR